ncbi:MAG TPA: hypothetical protein VHL58_11010 [Thermoanaerobaculia bacterium]|nr:hypothetical protein [Thermoanaerobaculia bacterium]
MTLLERLARITAITLVLFAAACETTSTDISRHEYLNDFQKLTPTPVRPVVVIPGFANSKLCDPDHYCVWGTARASVHTKYPDNLDLPIDETTLTVGHDKLEPRGFAGMHTWMNIGWVLSSSLLRFGKYKPEGSGVPGEVYELDFDWRLSTEDGARRLDQLIDRIREEHHDPTMKVDIVTHSGGGLIALAYARIGTASAERPEEWDAASRLAVSKIHRLVLLSVPQKGTVEAFRVMVRGQKIVRRDLTPEMVSTFPAVTEFLPADGRFLVDGEGKAIDADLWDIESWKRLQISIFDPRRAEEYKRRNSAHAYEVLTGAFENTLRHGHAFSRAMERPVPESVGVQIIASDCLPTVRRVLMRPDRSFVIYPGELKGDERKLTTALFEPGDGSVVLSSATSDMKNVTLLCVVHQHISEDRNARRTILRTLQAP